MKKISFLIAVLACLSNKLTAAETFYITDDFEITMRSGTSTSNGIVRMLRSGEPVTVLEHDLASKYSLVESSDKIQGYVLSRFLTESPAAKQSLQELEANFAQQRQQINRQNNEIDALNQSLEQEQADNETLKSTLRASEQELSEVRSAAQDALNILDQNKLLQSKVDTLQQQKDLLTDSNAKLSDSTRLDWFVRGGAVSLVAFVIGILVTRIRWRKDSWGSY